MKTIKLICIRHGQSLANVDKSIYETTPDFKIPLTPYGEQQATELGKVLAKEHDIKTILHSPWTRAAQTAKLIHDQNPLSHFIEEPLIHEISIMHSFEEMVGKEYLPKRGKDFSEHYFKEGTSESLMDAYIRARIFIQDLVLNRYEFEDGDTVAIVAHGTFLVTLKAVLKHYSLSQFKHKDHINNCEYFIETLKVY